MKNRVILNGQGIPIVPKSDKIAAKVAVSDAKASFKKAMLESFHSGMDTVAECLTTGFKKAIEAGHESIAIEDAIKLVAETVRVGKDSVK